MLTCHIGTRHLPGQIKHYVARSFRATIFNEPQLTTVGTAKGQPLAGCFWEQFASHCTNSTPNLLLKLSIAPEGMTFPLAEKLAVSHYISSEASARAKRWLALLLWQARSEGTVPAPGVLTDRLAQSPLLWWQSAQDYESHVEQPHFSSPKQMVPPNLPT